MLRQLHDEISNAAFIERLCNSMLPSDEGLNEAAHVVIKAWFTTAVQAFRKSPLFGHDHHCCQEYGPGIAETSNTFCRECEFQGLRDCSKCLSVEFKGDPATHFTFLKSCDSWGSYHSKDTHPWQGGWQYRRLKEAHQTKPASRQYLEDIGLGWCAFVSNKETRGNR